MSSSSNYLNIRTDYRQTNTLVYPYQRCRWLHGLRQMYAHAYYHVLNQRARPLSRQERQSPASVRGPSMKDVMRSAELRIQADPPEPPERQGRHILLPKLHGRQVHHDPCDSHQRR